MARSGIAQSSRTIAPGFDIRLKIRPSDRFRSNLTWVLPILSDLVMLGPLVANLRPNSNNGGRKWAELDPNIGSWSNPAATAQPWTPGAQLWILTGWPGRAWSASLGPPASQLSRPPWIGFPGLTDFRLWRSSRARGSTPKCTQAISTCPAQRAGQT